jgi:hypothetical protein
MLNFCSIVTTILKMATGRNFSMSGINSGHHNLPTYEKVAFDLFFKPIVSGRFGRLHNRLIIIISYYYHYSSLSFFLSFFPCTMNLSMADLRNYWTEFHETWWSYRYMRNFSMSRINSGHHYLPTYQILMISENVEFLRYCGGHFENGDR